nr:hypothetical protein CFP56_57529 [Quercus suber]
MKTRISSAKAKDISLNLGFDSVCRSDANGFSGGIWILWNSDEITLDILSVTDQAIHAFVQVCTSNPNSVWLFSAIYANPNLSTRIHLWEDLASFASCHFVPWLLAGDFNDILNDHENFSCFLPSHNCIALFNNLLNKCNLLDLGFNGPCFTSTNKRNNLLVMKRLDRALCNPGWLLLFEETNVFHLPKTSSDHHPLIT